MKSYLSDSNYRLRAPELKDLELMFQMENTSELWMCSDVTGPYSKKALEEYIQRSQNDLFVDHQLRLMVEEKEGAVVGIIDLFDFNPLNSRAEVGIAIFPSHRGKGIGQIALSLLNDFCFDYLGIHQLYAYIDVDNTICQAVFEACHYKRVVLIKDWMHGSKKQYRDVWFVQQINPFELS